VLNSAAARARATLVLVMTKAKLVLGVVVALAVALLAGLIWGGSGRSGVARALEASELRGELLGARAAVLDARVATYNNNFGETSGHLEDARGLLGRASERLTRLGRNDEVTRLRTVLGSVDGAQRLAGTLDQAAGVRAGDAAKTLADMLDADARR